MIKTISALSVALFLSACATGQPVTGTMHNCKQHCEQAQCKHGEHCTCADCRDMKGKICPMHAK